MDKMDKKEGKDREGERVARVARVARSDCVQTRPFPAKENEGGSGGGCGKDRVFRGGTVVPPSAPVLPGGL